MKTFLLLISVILPVTILRAQNKPNIIIFLVDDMGWQDTSVPFWDIVTVNNKKFNTPNMERLAKQSVKFTNAYAHSVCTPSRVSLLTGMNPARHRVTNWVSMANEAVDPKDSLLVVPNWNVNGVSPLSSDGKSVHATPLPQILRENGYYTIQCGKAHFGAYGTAGADPLQLGFTKNIGGGAAGNPASFFGENNYGYDPSHYNVKADLPNLKKYWNTSTFLTEALTQEAIVAMDSAQLENKPFFLYLSHYAVHLPFEADPRFVQKYLDKGYSASEAAYCALVEGMDYSLGAVMDYLEGRGIAEHTLILFMSDNGGYSHAPREGKVNTQNFPLKGGKGSLYEGGIREPMLVSWPGVASGGVSTDQYVTIEDFYPTLLEMVSISHYQPHQQLDGVSIVPYLKNTDKRDNKRALVWHYPNNWGGGNRGEDNSFMSAVRQGDWKLIYFQKSKKLELYNLKQDIEENQDVSRQYPKKVQQLAKILGKKLREANAQMPVDKTSGNPLAWPDRLHSK